MDLLRIKQVILVFLITLLGVTGIFAQPKGKPNKDKVKAMRVAYITEKLDLSSVEAQNFWPIYNEFDSKMEAIHKEIRKMHKQDDLIDEMTDSEIEKLLSKQIELRTSELALEKEYNTKFKTVLPIKKVAKLHKANHDFKRDLLKKLKDHKGGPPPPRH